MSMIIPKYKLPKRNVFNFRKREWDENQIVSTITEMLKAAEPYDIILKKVEFVAGKKSALSEIKRTISKFLRIEFLVKDTKTIELNYEIPNLIQNYFYVGGNRKIPILQIFDKPIIARKDMIKLRTNIQSVQLEKSFTAKTGFHYITHIFNKKIPLAHVLIAMKGIEQVKIDFALDDENMKVGENKLLLIEDLKKSIADPTLVEGKILSKLFRGRGENDILENIRLLADIDIFTKKYMYTDNVIDELVHALELKDSTKEADRNLLDDCSVENKRLRFLEYYLYSFLCKDFYNMIVTLKSSKAATFSNNSKVVLVNANSSPIIQYESPINPIDELARLTRIAMTGPGGFKKDNIPAYLRDIHHTMKGRICPADTGDRENCGTLLYLIPNLKLDTDGLFTDQKKDTPVSISILHVPFLEHDDPTRLQMASSQMRHSIMLKKFDLPLCQSGIEGMYTENTSFIFIAERDGSVIYKDKDVIVVQYNNRKCRAFNIGYKKSRLSIVDFYKTYFEVGERFKKGNIISESNFLHDGKTTIGRNLRTAVMTWYGYNYEDAVIISEKVRDEGKLTSIHYLDLTFEISPDKVLLGLDDELLGGYDPLPRVGQRMKKGDAYARIKTVSTGNDRNFDVIFDTESIKTVDENCTVVDVKVYVSKLNDNIEQYNHYIKNLVKNQNSKKQDLVSTLKNFLTKDELETFLIDLEIDESSKDEERFKIKGEAIEGVLVSITAIYERSIKVGDKLGNRHGNKGIVAAVVPDAKMPVTPDGNRAEIIINPLGILSRMNVGQLFELHMAGATMALRENIAEKYQKGLKPIQKLMVDNKDVTSEEKKGVIDQCREMADDLKDEIYEYVMGFIRIIDKTGKNYYSKQMQLQLDNTTLEDFIGDLDNFCIIQIPFETVKKDDVTLALEYVGNNYVDPCFEPISKKQTKNKVAFGYMYFQKLNHIAEDKCAVRGIGPYTSKTSQPLHGKVRKGGQRLGEMEIWSLVGHGAKENLNEIITTKSDSIQKRDTYISSMIKNDHLLWKDDEDSTSQSVRVLQSSMFSMGLGYNVREEDD